MSRFSTYQLRTSAGICEAARTCTSTAEAEDLVTELCRLPSIALDVKRTPEEKRDRARAMVRELLFHHVPHLDVPLLCLLGLFASNDQLSDHVVTRTATHLSPQEDQVLRVADKWAVMYEHTIKPHVDRGLGIAASNHEHDELYRAVVALRKSRKPRPRFQVRKTPGGWDVNDTSVEPIRLMCIATSVENAERIAAGLMAAEP